jgi:hypothetical protein
VSGPFVWIVAYETKGPDTFVFSFDALPVSGHKQLITIPGIGAATAAVLTAKIVDIERFQVPEALVGYFGIFPEENTSGVDKHGNPLPAGTMRMSPKGNDLARHYLWNAARVGIRYNPALRALYARLKARGKRGDVAIGHCMRKLLHLVYAVWKTNRPFNEQHFPWEIKNDPAAPQMSEAPTQPANEKAAGHKRDIPAEKVVTTAISSVEPTPPAVNTATPTSPNTHPSKSAARPKVDFTYLRQQITMEQVLRHLGRFDQLRGRGQQRRGPCPVHAQPTEKPGTFSVHLGKNICQCFQPDCAVHGNVLDLWAAVHKLPLYEAALHLTETFHLHRNREEEHVQAAH